MMTQLLIPKPQIAHQEQSKGQGLAIAVALGGIAWLLLRDSREGGQDPGNGGTGSLVTASGSIGTIETTMGNHLLAKAPGQTLSARVAYTVQAFDAQNNPVPWNYKLITELGHNTLGPFSVWRTSGELGFPENGSRTAILNQRSNGSTTALSFFVTPDDPAVEWDIHTELLAQESDGNGQPVLDSFVRIALGEHNGAVRTIGGQAAISGSIGTITVSRPRNAVSISRR